LPLEIVFIVLSMLILAGTVLTGWTGL